MLLTKAEAGGAPLRESSETRCTDSAVTFGKDGRGYIVLKCRAAFTCYSFCFCFILVSSLHNMLLVWFVLEQVMSRKVMADPQFIGALGIKK